MSKKQINNKTHLQSITISVILTFTAFFVMTGIGIIDIKGIQNGIGSKNSLASIEQIDDFNYTLSFMGNELAVDLNSVNQFAAFIKANSFLIPIRIRLAEQVITVIFLNSTNPSLLYQLTGADEISAFCESAINNTLNFYNYICFTFEQFSDNIQGVFSNMERNKIK